MAFKETAQLWSRTCEKQGGAKQDDRRAHSETKRTAKLCPVRTPMLWTYLFLFVMDFSKIQITVSFLYQTTYGYYCIELLKNISL